MMKKPTLMIIVLLLLVLPQNLVGQKNDKSIGLGWGMFQGINLNANYFYTENMSLGLGVGSHFGLRPLEDEKHFSFTIENRYHFGTPYEKRMRPWVFGQQVVYWTQNPGAEIWRIISIAPTFGVNLAFSNHIFLFFDIGPSVNLVVDVDRPPMSESSGWMWPILFNARGQLIYRF